jgi:general secretion pathway protein L
MSDWLFLRLPAAPGAAASWLVADSGGAARARVESGGLLQACAAAQDRRLCVLAPAESVLLTTVTLPVKGGARALQAAPFALEEQLIGDIEGQHFALGERDGASGHTPVAVVSKAALDLWLEQLRAAGLQPTLLCSEASLLAANPAQAQVLLDDDQLLARAAGPAALPRTLPATPLGEALDVALGQPRAATDLQIHVTDAGWARHQAAISALQPQYARCAVQRLGDSPLPWLALQFPTAAPINLLQGAYQQGDSRLELWRRWRNVAALAAACMVLALAGQAWSLWQVSRAERTVDTALSDLAAQWFPDNRSSSNLRARVQQQLGKQTDGAAPLLAGLQGLATALGGNARILGLSYRDGRMELRLRGNDAQAIERVVESLKSAGWAAELVSGAAAGGGYEGRLQVRQPGGRA